MATQVITTTHSDADTKTKHSTHPPPKPFQGASSGDMSTLDALSSKIGAQAQERLDRVFPPDQRQDAWEKVQAFVAANQKVSAFLAVNIAFTGIPLLLFAIFAISTAVFTILSGILLGLLGGVFFTLFWVGIALAVILPILIFTTASACFIFMLGLAAYRIWRWTSVQNGDKTT